MRRILTVTFAGMAIAGFQSAALASGADEAKEHGCVKCHEVDKKKVGPSWKDVSAKYKGKSVDEAMAGMKSKSVHKASLKNTQDSSLKTILSDYVLKQ